LAIVVIEIRLLFFHTLSDRYCTIWNPNEASMKTLLLAVSFFFCQLVYAADTWQEPEDFRGVKWGASLEEMRKVFPNITSNLYRTPLFPSERIRGANTRGEKIGPVEVSLHFGFLDEKFSGVLINFKSNDFSVLRDAFIARYGPSHSKQEVVVKNRAGAEFLNEVLVWRGATMTIEIKKYASTITNGSAMLEKHEYRDEKLRAWKSRSQDAAKGL
jgi:hypothetical protein